MTAIGAPSALLVDDANFNNTDDATEQIAILLKSLKILTQLAAMDPAEYQASLQMKMVHNNNDNNNNNHTSNTTQQCSVIQLQTSLEDLQRGWRLEDTPVIQLCTLIHGLHSTVNSLQKDAEEHAVLYANLQKELLDSHQRNAKLERTLLKVHSKNQSLSHKMKQRSCETRSLVKHVHACVQQVHESQEEQKQLEEQNVAFQLHAHHQFLQQQQQQQQQQAVNSPMRPGRGRSFSHDVLQAYPTTFQTMRYRGMSHDTNFSDMDALDFAAANDATVLDDEIGLGDVVDGGYAGNIFDDLSCCPSVASSTLVTDDGVATPLRLSQDGNTTKIQSIALRHDDGNLSPPGTPRRESASARKRTNSRDLDFGFGTSFLGGAWSSSKSKESVVIHDLTFPDASSIGLQFERLPYDSPPAKKEIPKPKGLLTEAMLSNSSSHDSSAPSLPGANSNSSEEKDDRQKSGFQLKWKVFSSRSSGSQEADRKQSNGTFAISGFDGFINELNERPAIGEKLIAINDVPVDGTWSVEELQAQIEQACARVQTDTIRNPNQEEKKCSEHEDTCLTLRFCKEPLTRKERGILERAKHEQEYYEDEWGLPCKKPPKDLASANKQTPSSSSGSSSKYSFMNSMSPKRKQKSKNSSSNVSSQKGVVTKEEEEIPLSSSSSSSAAPTKPVLKTVAKAKEATQKIVTPTASEEKVESAVIQDSAKASTATNIFSFFSPQKVENTDVVVADIKANELNTGTTVSNKKGESSTPVPSSHKEQDSATVENPPGKSVAGDAPANCQTPSTAIKEKKDVSTGEKIFGSVKSLGDFFANPYP